mgnify:CR=1 FL=1
MMNKELISKLVEELEEYIKESIYNDEELYRSGSIDDLFKDFILYEYIKYEVK